MARDFEDEDVRALEPKEPHPIPVGWGVLFWGLVLFGAYYLWAYTPALGGWSQERELAQAAGQASSAVGVNVFATVAFTAVATVVAVALLLAFARRKRARREERPG